MNNTRALGRLLVWFVLVSLTSFSWAGSLAADVPKIDIKPVSVGIKVDGEVQPEEWATAFTQDGFVDPVSGAPARNRTTVYLTYDTTNIYVGFRAYCLEPDEITAREIRPGASFNGEDYFAFRINPFGTRSGAGRSWFAVNVLNTQSDRIAGGRSAKREWRGEWLSGTKRLPDGWSAEMAIPWKMLNYPSGSGLSMDVVFERLEGKRQLKTLWPNTGVQEWADRAAQWVNVNPPPMALDPWQFLGYVAPEYDRTNSGVRAGLDVRAQPSSTVTGLVSFNPDFRNIEAQIAGIDFTRTERFLEEVRPFFTEGNAYFRMGPGFGFGSMFYTNRIAQFDVGAKSFGRINPRLDYGVLMTSDTGNQTAGAARMHLDPGPRGDMDIYATSLTRKGGYRHEAYGGSYYTQRGSFALSASAATERDQSRKFTSAGNASVNYEVPNWFSTLNYGWVRPDFAPPLGFIPWANRRGFYSYTEHFREFRSGPIRDYRFDAFGSNFEQYDGSEQQKGLEVGGGFTTRGDLRVGFNHTNTRFFGQLDRVFGASISPNVSNRFRQFGLYAESGQRGGQKSSFTAFQGNFRVWKRLDLGISQSVFSLGGTTRQTIATVGYELTPTKSITGRFVSNNGNTNGYFAYRDGGGSGTELYVIVGDPNTQRFVSRLSVKVVVAF